MGKVLSVASRPFRNYNLESRAHKAISRDKPIAAPKHKSDVLDYDRIIRDYPEILADSLKKHTKLDQNLKDVYVKSHDTEPIKEDEPITSNRKLPLDRRPIEDFEFGLKEPNKIPIGKTTLRKALRFISEHQADPNVYTSTKIAQDHALPEETIKNVLKYFRVFEIYIPQQRKVKASFAGPALPKREIRVVQRKELGAGKLSDDT